MTPSAYKRSASSWSSSYRWTCATRSQLVRTAESRLRAAASARSASEQQYASEQRKLDAGQSTVFLVLERQTQLATARGNELRAQTELNKAIAELQRATGNSLEQNRVEIVLK